MKLTDQLGAWTPLLAPMLEKPWCKDLFAQVDAAYQAGDPPVYPPQEAVFTALRLTPPESVRCVILGQDPYPEPGQAHGLAFSVPKGAKIPPSLRNIYGELESDLGCYTPNHGCLTSWAEHGVLLLNNVLTVYQGKANSHKKWGWQPFTAGILAAVQTLSQPVAYLLWGSPAEGQKAAGQRCSPTDPQRRPSQPALCLPRLFRQPPIQPGQSLFGLCRRRPHSLVGAVRNRGRSGAGQRGSDSLMEF